MAYAIPQHRYLQDYIRHSVPVSQKRNGHMQVYITIMAGLYIYNGRQIELFNIKSLNYG